MPHVPGSSNTGTDTRDQATEPELDQDSIALDGDSLPLTDENLAWVDNQLTQIPPGSRPQPQRNISCDLSPEAPYAVIDTNLHDDIHCSPADAIATWLHHWDPQILEDFLDTENNETVHIEQKEEEEGPDGTDPQWVPILVLDRIHNQIRICYFEDGIKTEYRVNVVEDTGEWIPVFAAIDGQVIHGDDPTTKWAGALITARILYDEAWMTANRARLRVRVGG